MSYLRRRRRSLVPSTYAEAVAAGWTVTTLTLQPDGTDGIDALVSSDAPTTNYATLTYTVIGDGGDAQQYASRALIAFSGLSAIPASAFVGAVTLSLFNYQVANAPAATPASQLRRVLRNWVEAQVTYNIYSTGNNWGTSGCSANGTDRVATASAVATLPATSANSFIEWSGSGLVSDVQGWVSGTAANYGWLLSADDAEFLPTVSESWRFYLSDYATDTAKRPKLAVTYASR